MDEYTELRSLLLQQEQHRLAELEQRIADLQQRSQDVAEILPSALQRTPDLAELIAALQTPVDHCVKTTVTTDPHSFAEPLLPVMTPVIQQPLLDRYQQLAELEQHNVEQLQSRLQTLANLEQTNVAQLQARLEVLEQALIHFKALEAQLNDAENRVKELATFLPKAIRQASDDNDSETATPTTATDEEAELTDSLKVPVQRCLRQSISEDTETLADTLFPVMGPAIRKSINESLKGFIEEINTRVEQSPLSPQGLNWWVESKRKGIPVRELILRDTLVYRIEEVFLIHNESGLLIHHLHQEDIEVGDSDAVSAMFTAIQDFIRDSFSSARNASLDKVEIGEHMVWLERGPYAVLACVIRGAAPYEYKQLMSQVIETLHARYGKKLQHFDGDNSPLEPCLPLLQKTLQSERKEKDKAQNKGIPKGFAIAAGVLLVLSLGLFSWWQYDAYLQRDLNTRINAYITALHQTPGIVPVSHHYQAQQLTIQGLRDPLALATVDLPQRAALTDIIINEAWKPYQDLTPAFTEQRLQQVLAPPETVKVQLVDNTLFLKGHADDAWIASALQEVRRVSGVTEVVTEELVESDAYWQQTQPLFRQLVQRLDATPGLVVIASGVERAQYFIRGLRDPLALDPFSIAAEAAFAALENVGMAWQPYQDLSPQFVEQRARTWLQAPESVELRLEGTTLTASGNASQTWISQLQDSLGKINGITALNIDDLVDNDAYWAQTQPIFTQLVAALNDTVGVTVVESGIVDNHYFVQGLRDPLAPDPDIIIQQFPELHQVATTWQAYQDLAPALIKRRAIRWLQPPSTVSVTLHGTTLKLSGEADEAWITAARDSLGKLLGIEELDLSALTNTDQYWLTTRPQFAELINQLNATTGLTVLDSGARAGRYYVRGLRDPLAPEPQRLVAQFPDLAPVDMHWQIYQDLAPELVKHRAIAWLQPPDSVSVTLQDAHLTLSGTASSAWIQQAQDSVGKIAGVATLDTSGLTATDAYWLETRPQFAALLADLNATPGLIVVDSGVANEQYFVRGLRDPLAVDPVTLLNASGLTKVNMDWQTYQDLDPAFVLQRAGIALQPPSTVTLAVQDTTLKLSGEASHDWIVRTQQHAGQIAGIDTIDRTELVDTDSYWLTSRPQFAALVAALNATPGLVVVESGIANDQYFVRGLRDPLASDPATLVTDSGLTQVTTDWQPYQDMSLPFVRQRLLAWLDPPDSVEVTWEADTVSFSGAASRQWLEKARQANPALLTVNTQAVVDQAQVLRKQLIQSIEKARIFFNDGADIRRGQDRKLKKLAEQIQQLINMTQGTQFALRIEMTGNTDGLGTRLQNQQLGLQRALAIRNWLHNTYAINRQYLLIMPPIKIRSGAVVQNFRLRYVGFRVSL